MNKYTLLFRTLRPTRRRDKDAGWAWDQESDYRSSCLAVALLEAGPFLQADCHQGLPTVTGLPPFKPTSAKAKDTTARKTQPVP